MMMEQSNKTTYDTTVTYRIHISWQVESYQLVTSADGARRWRDCRGRDLRVRV
jgi:hypothetical protein